MPPAAAHPSPPYAPVASAGPAALGGTPATPDPRLAPEVQLSRPGTPPGVSPRAVQPTDQRVAGPAPEAGGGGPYHPQHTQAPPGLRLVQSGQGQPEPPRQPQPPAAEPAQHARHQPPYPSQSPAQHTQTPQGPQAPQPPHQPYTQSASQMPQMPHPQMPHNPQSPQTPRQAAQQLRADPNWNGRNAVGAGGHAAPDATQAYAQVPPGQISSQYPSAVDTVRGATPAFGPDQPPSQSARSDHEWTQRNPGQFSTGGSQPNGHHRVSP